MARFAPVGPPKLLRNIRGKWEDEAIGHYHLVLAHDIVENKEDWKGTLPKESTVILDNSFVELGNSPAALETIFEAYRILSHEGFDRLVIVPPETFNDPARTKEQFQEGLNYFQARAIHDVEFMYVLQAHTINQISKAAFDFWLEKIGPEWEQVKWIGIPRTITERMGTRMYAVLECLQLKLQFPDLNIHLLGFSNNIQDDIFCARMPMVEGIDSAVPLRLGQQNKEIDLHYIGDQAGPRGDYWSHEKPGLCTFPNIFRTRRHLSRTYFHDMEHFTPELEPEVKGDAP
jgi:hypothetical protein